MIDLPIFEAQHNFLKGSKDGHNMPNNFLHKKIWVIVCVIHLNTLLDNQ